MIAMDSILVILIAVGVLLLLGLVVLALYMNRSQQDGLTRLQSQGLSRDQERAVMAYPHDGIADIYFGLLILAFGLSLFSGMPWMTGAMIAIFVPLYQVSKRSYTGPRISQIAFTPARHSGLVKIVTILLILGIIALVASLFGLVAGNRLPPAVWDTLLYSLKVIAGVGGALLWCIAAFLGDVKRYYMYALLTLVLIAGASLSGVPVPFAVILLGLVVFATGLAVLYRFVHRYPETA